MGMKYNGASAQEVKRFDYLAVFAQPDNPVDKNALLVRGFTGTEWKDLGHCSMDSQPPPSYGLPKYGVNGTVYTVIESYSHSAESAAVHVRLELGTEREIEDFEKDERKRLNKRNAIMGTNSN